MRIAALALSTVVALCACGGHRRESVAADTSVLHACETRQLQFDGVDATVVANADASLAEVDLTGGDFEERRTVMHEVYKAFGKPQIDTNVRPTQLKWGLTAWVDRCGRTVSPHAQPTTTR